MLNILLPISKIENKTYNSYPKNLVEIDGKPLIQLVIESLSTLNVSFTFVISSDEARNFHTDKVLRMIESKCNIMYTNGPTAGAAATCLLAQDFYANDDELIIVAGDQIIQSDLNIAIESFRKRNLDGGILTFKSVHPKWSYVQTNDEELVTLVQEKQVISDKATAGLFYFKHGRYFSDAAKEMIKKRDHLNEVYYVSHVFNQMILSQFKIGIFSIDQSNYNKLGTPEEIEKYIQKLDIHNG